MSDNKKLIEEARSLQPTWHRGMYGSRDDMYANVKPLVSRLADALEAAEKALTPTDDEREARLEYVIDAAVPMDEFPSWRFRYSRRIADAVRAAGFRHSVVPEPSTEEKIEWPDHWTINEKLRDLHARWHDQKGNLLGRDACGWEGCEFWDSAQFTLRLADVHIAGREPQDEPSDDVANAVARAIIEHDEDRHTCYDHPEDFCCPCGEHGMSRSEWQRHRSRAALRAASAAEQTVVTSLPGNTPDQSIWCHTGRDHGRCEKPGCACDCHPVVTGQGENR